jgi:hypothetical protein
MRPRMRPRTKYGSGETDTYCEINGVECDVKVTWESSPEEKDVNWSGSFEVNGVWFEDQGNLINKMTTDELESLEQRMLEENYPDPDDQY